MAKNFFYVCAGLFLLAIGAALGGSVARAQLSGTIAAAGLTYCGGNCAYAVVGRTLYAGGNGFEVTGTPFVGGPIPGTEPVIAVGQGAHNAPLVMLANGDVYWGGGGPSGQDWQSVGNAVGGATPGASPSWGQLKVQYR